MTWETKLGLLVGMGVIILIGILISDHLSQAQRQQQARLDRSLPELEEDPLPSPIDPQGRESGSAGEGSGSGANDPLPPADRGGGDTGSARADSSQPSKPDTIRQDLQPERAYSTERSGRSSSQPGGSERPETADAGGSDSLPPGFTRVEGPGAQSASQDSSGSGGHNGSNNDQAERAERSSNTDRSSSSGSDNGSGSDADQGSDEPEQIVHHVKKGETLYDIARRYYDNPNYWKMIREANESRIPSAGRLRPGVRLVIPNKAGEANTPSSGQASSASPEPEPVETRTDPVQRGDSLSELAERFLGSSGDWRKLYQLNKDRIEDPNRLKPGIILRVPRR
jgi:nucleoid-associated protein YgaU